MQKIVLLAALLLATACTSAPERPAMKPPTDGGPARSAATSPAHAADAPRAQGEGQHGEEHGDHEHGETAAHPPIPGAARVEVAARDFAFTVGGKETPIEVTQPVNIVLVNQGKVEHEFHVAEPRFHLHVDVGETAAGGLRGVEPGRYRVVCTVPGHEQLGMVTTLVVKA